MMPPYEISPEFMRLKKIAELEKRISGAVTGAKDENGPIGLKSIDSSPESVIPKTIKRVMIIRGRSPLPLGIMNKIIDGGHDELISHIAKHKIMMTPGEALYSALGRKSPDIFEQIKNITLGEIFSLISNKAAVASTCAPSPMKLDDFDVPKHVKVMIRMRGMMPDELYKDASNTSVYKSEVDGFKFEFSNGAEIRKPKSFVKQNSDTIQDMIDDGAIIKVIQILSSGKERTVFDKTASFDDEDALYIEMLNGRDIKNDTDN